MIQLLGRHNGSSAKQPSFLDPSLSTPYEGYSATYAYVRESNMQGERRDGGGSKEKQSKAEGTWKRVAGGQASL